MVFYLGSHLRVFQRTLVEFSAVELVVKLTVNCPCAHNTGGHVDVCRPCGASMDSHLGSLVLGAGEG